MSKSSKDIRVLVVDDQVLCRDLIRTVVNNLGFSVVSADCAKSALKLLHQRKFDVVLCDYRMPDMTGVELLRSIRAGNDCPQIAFVMLTGESSPELVKDAITSGADDYVTKPFSASTLGEKLINVVERRIGPFKRR